MACVSDASIEVSTYYEISSPSFQYHSIQLLSICFIFDSIAAPDWLIGSYKHTVVYRNTQISVSEQLFGALVSPIQSPIISQEDRTFISLD